MRRASLLSATFACLLSLSGALRAQTATGQITGTVRDPSGAVMSNVKVTVSSQLTGLTREAATSEAGDYVVPLLPVGQYSVTAEQSGFRAAKRSDIRLNVDQVVRIDLELEVGAVTETVEVQAASVAIDTETATVGHVVTLDERHEVAEKLRKGEVSVVCAVDVLNEGADIPFVECLLFLRPTESQRIFFQQLGRGLRRYVGKSHCIVIDFIGRFKNAYRIVEYQGLLPLDLAERVRPITAGRSRKDIAGGNPPQYRTNSDI